MRHFAYNLHAAYYGALYFVAFAMAFFIPATPSHGNSFCVKQYYAQLAREGPQLGITPSEAEALVRDVASSIGLDSSTVVVFPCEQSSKAHAYYADGSLPGVPRGDYIVYNPTWIREVIGNDRFQAIALFGHELGHHLNRDFTGPKVPLVQMETRADQFAGCAVARLGGDWPTLANLFSRLRDDVDGTYPSRLKSLEAAKNGFERCNGASPPPPPPPVHPNITVFELSPGKIERGKRARLRWSVNNATSVSIEPGIGTVPTSDSTHVSPSETTTYTIVARGPSGIERASAELEVIPPQLTCSIDARYSTWNWGGSVRVSIDGESTGSFQFGPGSSTAMSFQCEEGEHSVKLAVTGLGLPTLSCTVDIEISSSNRRFVPSFITYDGRSVQCALTPY